MAETREKVNDRLVAPAGGRVHAIVAVLVCRVPVGPALDQKPDNIQVPFKGGDAEQCRVDPFGRIPAADINQRLEGEQVTFSRGYLGRILAQLVSQTGLRAVFNQEDDRLCATVRRCLMKWGLPVHVDCIDFGPLFNQ